ncbi:MAG TPA: diguanylate cyclase [Chromatiales bacterium]|nr:diguanylate cyclase [Chromatiales bacterium]
MKKEIVGHPFHFQDSIDEAGEYLKKAVGFLAKHRISPTPANYTIGYEYAAGRNEALVKALEKRSRRSGIVDGHLLADLFEEYYLHHPGEEYDSHLNGISKMLSEMLSEISSASDEVVSYGEELEGQLNRLEAEPSQGALKEIVENLVGATRNATRVNRELQAHLEDAKGEAAQLREELNRVRQESRLDPLTGLYNRKMLAESLEEQVAFAHANGTPLSVLMLDIDHFKRFNDEYGHQIGDEVIRRVAAAMKKHIRGTDTAARYGGEEFVVLLPETHLEGATTVARTVHSAVAKLSLIKKATQEKLPGITVSVGIGLLRNEEQGEALIERADQALYRAKRTGRNRIVTELELEEDEGFPAGDPESCHSL